MTFEILEDLDWISDVINTVKVCARSHFWGRINVGLYDVSQRKFFNDGNPGKLWKACLYWSTRRRGCCLWDQEGKI